MRAIPCLLEFHYRKRVAAVCLVSRAPAADAPPHGGPEPGAEALLEGARAVPMEQVQGRHPRHLGVGHALHHTASIEQQRAGQ